MLTQPTLSTPGTPQRLSTSNIHCRSFVVEAHKDNVGNLYLSDTEANATTNNRHCFCAGARMHFNADNWGNLDAQFNLKLFWFDGAEAGDKFIVSYYTDYDRSQYDGLDNV